MNADFLDILHISVTCSNFTDVGLQGQLVRFNLIGQPGFVLCVHEKGGDENQCNSLSSGANAGGGRTAALPSLTLHRLANSFTLTKEISRRFSYKINMKCIRLPGNVPKAERN